MSKIEQERRFLEFVMESDRKFYEKYLVNLTKEELKSFIENNPDFPEWIREEI